MERDAPISSRQEIQTHKKYTSPSLRIGFIPQGNAIQLVKQWQSFLEYISGEINMPVEFVIKSNYQGVIDSLADSEMDVALLGSFAYIQAYTQSNVSPIAVRVMYGSSNYYSIVIVRKDSGINSINDLKGRTFAFTDENSTTGYLLPANMLREKGFGKPEAFFSKIIRTGNHDSALLAVYNKSVDGASISTTRWIPTNNKINELKIIWRSPPIPLGPFVARKGLSRDLVKKIRNAFLKVGKTPNTIELAKQISVDGFSEVLDSQYNVVRNIQRKYSIKGFGE
jgi:phosphonate transport system substrate-binding protein